MNEPSAQHPGPGEDAQALRDLHRLYLQFMLQFGQERGRDYPRHDYPDFAAWWRGLDPITRQVCERNFRKGYAAVVEEGERQVAAVLAKYQKGENGSR